MTSCCYLRGGGYADYTHHFHSAEAVRLDDDLVVYMLDTLNWIPTINPSNPTQWKGWGLNYYGPTVISKVGAPKAARIFGLWADLLDEGPDEYSLTSGYE